MFHYIIYCCFIIFLKQIPHLSGELVSVLHIALKPQWNAINSNFDISWGNQFKVSAQKKKNTPQTPQKLQKTLFCLFLLFCGFFFEKAIHLLRSRHNWQGFEDNRFLLCWDWRNCMWGTEKIISEYKKSGLTEIKLYLDTFIILRRNSTP